MVCAALAGLVSCNDRFLDTMPDNRAEVDTPDKVKAMLVAAYSTRHYAQSAEMYSDNMDDNAKVVSNASPGKYYEQIWNWEDITETANDSPDNVWQHNWKAIAAANQALEAIEQLGGKDDPNLSASYGEALLCRAYGHFVLVNIFCLNYNKATSATDQGIPYMETVENGLNPQYERGNVADVYEKIEKDIEEGLKYVKDNYVAPKYHFTRQAAYAFATRFYLFYEKWDKAIEAANNCLGTAPQTILRDNDALSHQPDIQTAAAMYVASDQKCNLLLQTNMSPYMGRNTWRNTSGAAKRYAFTTKIAETEVLYAKQPWMKNGVTGSSYRFPPRDYNASTLHYTLVWKVPNLFEYTDPVAGRGYTQTIVATFTTDQVLLERAEAYVMKKEYDLACEDLKLWINNTYKPGNERITFDITPQSIQAFYAGVPYYTWDEPTTKKHLHPGFAIEEEGSVQESMLHAVLGAKRIETLAYGYRWLDIKRYGIEIYRRHVDAVSNLESISDTMTPNDLRRAFQVPQRARDAGFEPTKRADAENE
jgi:tetratricopeptide (TPR) repeat protein